MQDDADFTAYVEARWSALVRTLVLLGSTSTEATSVAERALASCYLRWRTISAADDIDVQVYGEVYAGLLAARAGAADRGADRAAGREADGGTDRPTGPPAERAADLPAAGPGPVAGTAPADAVLLLDSLLAALDRLDGPDRAAVVLQHGAGLTAVQVAEVLEADPFEVEQRAASAVGALDVEGMRGHR